MVRLVKIGTDGEKHCADVLKINRPDDLSEIADLEPDRLRLTR